MHADQADRNGAEARLLPWVPLLAGAINSYGPVGNNYGFALYFLDYRHGFVKRGLVGALFSHAAFLSRGHLLLIEYLFLAAAFALACVVFRPVLFGDRNDMRLAVLLLSAPAVLPHIGYLFAQPDVTLFLLLLLSLLAFLRLTPWAATIVSLPLCCVALLGHEAFSLMFYPLVMAILLQLCRTRRLPWAAAGLHVGGMLLAMAAILHFGRLKVPSAVLLAEASARTDVAIQPQVYAVMGSTLAQQQALVHKLYSTGVLQVLALTVVLVLPYYALLFRLLRRTMTALAFPALQQVATVLLLLAPLPLCALGHDTTRWIGAMGIDLSLFLLYLLMMDGEDGRARGVLRAWAASPGYLPTLAYLLLLGPMGATGLRTAEQLVQAWTGT